MKHLLLVVFILVFSNAFSNWTFVNTIPTSPVISSISVVNANTIWACGNASKLYRSTDAGATWVLRNGGIPAATDLYGLSALDTTNCWVGTIAGSIYHTSNGGSNWTLQFSLAGSFTDGIQMFTSTYGIYYGDPTAAGQPYQLRYTTNSGTNWLLSPGSPIAANEFGVINAWDWTDTGRVWIGSANINASPTTANIYKTTSGFRGGGWATVTLTGTGGTAGLYYQAIGFTDVNNGLAGSNGSDIRKSTDGGVTWLNVTPPPSVPVFAAINMNGLKDGSKTIRISENVSATSNFVFRTTDLGTSWISEPIPAQGTAQGLQHMQFVNSALGYAGGNAGAFLKYSNITVKVKIIIEGFYNSGLDNLSNRDTLRAYLRNNTTPFAVVDSALAVIDTLSFSGYFLFENAGSGTYYIQTKHRNALETWSETGGEAYVTGNSYNYDFTTAAAKAFGSNMVQVNTSPVRFGIYSGDVTHSGNVDLADIIVVQNDGTNFVTGYKDSDVNGDRFTNLADLIITYNNSAKFVAKITP